MKKPSLKLRAATSRPSKAVSMEGTTVIKKVHANSVQREATRTACGRDIGLVSGLYCTPNIIAVNEDSIVLEKFEELGSIRSRLNEEDGLSIAKKIGEALGAIHSIQSKSPHWVHLAAETRAYISANENFYHGDFNTYNVLYNHREDKLCILDWTSPDWAGSEPFVGNRYFDLCVFIISVFSRRVLEHGLVQRPDKIIDQFILGYRDNSIVPFNSRELSRTFEDVISVFATPRGTLWEKLAKRVRKHSFRTASNYCARLSTREPEHCE